MCICVCVCVCARVCKLMSGCVNVYELVIESIGERVNECVGGLTSERMFDTN